MGRELREKKKERHKNSSDRLGSHPYPNISYPNNKPLIGNNRKKNHNLQKLTINERMTKTQNKKGGDSEGRRIEVTK